MIIQPSDISLEPINKVYDGMTDTALGLLAALLNREKENFVILSTSLNENQINAELGLTIERVEEQQSQSKNGQGEDSSLTQPNVIPKSSEFQSKSSINSAPLEKISKVAESQPETKLLYGLRDGKLVNNLSRAETLAVAAMVNGELGNVIANGANLRIKFNGKVIAETDNRGNLIINEVYAKVPKNELVEFNNRIAKIAETDPSVDIPAVVTPIPVAVSNPHLDLHMETPAITMVAKNLAKAPQTAGKSFLERLFPPFGKQQTLTPEQETIKEHLAKSDAKDTYVFKNIPKTDINYINTAISFSEANTPPGYFLTSPKGYVISSELNPDQTVNYQFKTPDGKVAIDVTKNPATGLLTINNCQLTSETYQYLKDLQMVLDRPPIDREQVQKPIVDSQVPTQPQPEQIPTSAGNKLINLTNLKPEELIKNLDEIEATVEAEDEISTADDDINLVVGYDPTIDRVSIKEVNVSQTATDRWNALEHQVNVDRAEEQQFADGNAPPQTPLIPTSDQVRATASGAAHQKNTRTGVPDSVKLADAPSQVIQAGTVNKTRKKQLVNDVNDAKAAKTKKIEKDEKTAPADSLTPEIGIEIETPTPPLTKKEQLLVEAKANKAIAAKTPKTPTKAKTAAKGGR